VYIVEMQPSQVMFNQLNRILFGGRLPSVPIRAVVELPLEENARLSIVGTRTAILLNAYTWAAREPHQQFGTILHEMIHLSQLVQDQEVGHNASFEAIARAVSFDSGLGVRVKDFQATWPQEDPMLEQVHRVIMKMT
jgi:hypothetical protein